MQFAPLTTPWARRFQTLGALHYVVSFVFLAQICLAFFVYTFFTRIWPLSVIYLVYMWFDWKTPERGGRPIYAIKNWGIWYGMRDYFPIKIHKTADLDPRRNYLLICYPHGVLCPGTFLNLTSAVTDTHKLFPGFDSYLTMLPFWFRIPLFRDYILSGSLVSSTKASIKHLITKPKGGNLVGILPGGAPESLDARPGDVKIIVRQRMGFVKMAKVHGVPLVPCFSFGDHELWDQAENPPGSKLRKFQEFSMKYLDVAFPAFHARGIFQYNYGLLPRRRPLNFVVGAPIEVEKDPNPSSEELVALREKYIEKLEELFNKHKTKYLNEDVKLIIS
ncbi:2-acylglycerol O-acyltransferase 2-A-like [Styela clava]